MRCTGSGPIDRPVTVLKITENASSRVGPHGGALSSVPNTSSSRWTWCWLVTACSSNCFFSSGACALFADFLHAFTDCFSA